MLAQAVTDWQPYLEYLLLLSGTLLALLLSLYIVFQAYRGYRRNDSRRMLFLAVGLALVTVAPFLLSLFATAVGQSLGFGPRVFSFYLPFGSRILQLVGLVTIVYSLHEAS